MSLLDDGIVVDSDGSVVDENEYPIMSLNTSNNTWSPTSAYNSLYTNRFSTSSSFNHASGYNSYVMNKSGPRSEVLLSSVIVQKFSDIKLEKAKAKKEKKDKKRQKEKN